ncbi:MAG TPA: hypothetical protein VJT67_09785 [Longimicrobiaceae bacterium]|nr:hypothetical protein [Longimicrobiaceae bacterium]
MYASTALRAGALIVLAAAIGWLGDRALLPRDDARSPSPPAMPTPAMLDSATLALRGPLTREAREELARQVHTGAALLVLLDSADIRVCEDLGRQLRELRRSSPASPWVIVTAPSALVRVQAFARRERLQPAVYLALNPARLIEHIPHVPTPAAVLARNGEVAGVAHTRRFRNVRGCSFAEELAAFFPAPAGSTSPPTTRRMP